MALFKIHVKISGDYQSLHPLGTMNVYTKCCTNPSSSCRDNSQNKRTLWHAGGARGKVRVSLKSSSSGHHGHVYKISWQSMSTCWWHYTKSDRIKKVSELILWGPWLSFKISWQSIKCWSRYFSVKTDNWLTLPSQPTSMYISHGRRGSKLQSLKEFLVSARYS